MLPSDAQFQLKDIETLCNKQIATFHQYQYLSYSCHLYQHTSSKINTEISISSSHSYLNIDNLKTSLKIQGINKFNSKFSLNAKIKKIMN